MSTEDQEEPERKPPHTSIPRGSRRPFLRGKPDELGAVLEPIEQTATDRYQKIKREILEWVKRSGPPSPDEYSQWYAKHRLGTLLRVGIDFDLRHCARCHRRLETKNGEPILVEGRKSGRGAKRYCSDQCKKAAKDKRKKSKKRRRAR